jgi:hypothetical protein
MRPTIPQIRSVGDFQKQYTWEIGFLRNPSFTSITPFRMNLQCMSAEIPKKTGQTATIMIRGNQIFDPGIYQVAGTLTLQFIETVDSTIRKFIADWETACAEKSGTFQQLTGDLYLRTTDNQDTPNMEYWILWAFLEDSNPGQLEGGNSDPMQPSITLRYTDYVAIPLV